MGRSPYLCPAAAGSHEGSSHPCPGHLSYVSRDNDNGNDNGNDKKSDRYIENDNGSDTCPQRWNLSLPSLPAVV